MKKVFAFILILVMISPLLVVPGVSAQDQKVTIELWQHDSGGKITAMQSVIEGFNEQYPNVEVVQTVIPYD
jgi:ABC-type glycerol-3-phosphate transport system substrate-binding protein